MIIGFKINIKFCSIVAGLWPELGCHPSFVVSCSYILQSELWKLRHNDVSQSRSLTVKARVHHRVPWHVRLQRIMSGDSWDLYCNEYSVPSYTVWVDKERDILSSFCMAPWIRCYSTTSGREPSCLLRPLESVGVRKQCDFFKQEFEFKQVILLTKFAKNTFGKQ